MTYVYIENGLTDDGWGVYGVFKLAIKPKQSERYPERVEVKIEDMIVGRGPGWDDSGSYDETWLKRACVLINRYGMEDEL